MAAGMPYNKALEKADRAERKQRRRSGDMKKLTHNRQTLPDAMQVHELHERCLMASGWPYSKAHIAASRLELHCRRHPDELHDALAGEGWS